MALKISSAAQLMLKPEGDSLITYYYRGGDEFSGTSLDGNMWNNGLGWTRVIMSQDLAFSPHNVEVEKGLLGLIANKEDSVYVLQPWEIDSTWLKKQKLALNGNRFTTHYSAGCVITKEKFHYGLYEVRFRVEEGRGVWPAFWFYGGEKSEEIDAFELKGEKNNRIHVDTHCPDGCNNYKSGLFKKNYGGWMRTLGKIDEGFLTMQLEWLPGEVRWYLNGSPVAYFKGRFDHPMNIYLNTSVAKNGGSFKPGPDDKTRWPNVFAVDYIRIYERALPGALEVIDEFKHAGQPELIVNSSLEESDLYPSIHEVMPARHRGYMYNKKLFRQQPGMVRVNLDSDNKLKITLLGFPNAATVRIDKHNETISNEGYIQLNPGDKQIRLILETGGKTYSKVISTGKRK
jgi:beta-glucanase (GH16 family)